MTEDQIERHAQVMIDRLDAQFMSGKLTQDEYDERMEKIDEWATRQYSLAARA